MCSKKNYLSVAILFLLCLGTVHAVAQTQVSGTVVDEGRDPLVYASVSLLTENNALIQQQMTDIRGAFELKLEGTGNFRIKVEYIGWTTLQKDFLIKEGQDILSLDTMVMVADVQSLQGIEVTASQRLIEQKNDRTVINVENTILAEGQTAMDILKRAPGVQINDDGAIAMRGKQGVKVMINGKLSYLSEKELANLLKGTSSTQLKSIELITSPSARYDAEGSAGMINIVMRTNKQAGWNGAVHAFGAQSRKSRVGGGALLGYKAGNWNIMANYDAAYRGEEEFRYFDRLFTEQASGTLESVSNQYSRTREPLRTQNARIQVDFQPWERTSFYGQWSGDFGDYENNSQGYNKIFNAQQQLQSDAETDNVQRSFWNTQTISVGAEQLIGEREHKLSADFDYTYADYNARQSLISDFQHIGSRPGYLSWRKGRTPSQTHVYVAKLDYTHRITDKQHIDIGAKSSWIKADNRAVNDTLRQDVWIPDAETSNHFLYEEQVHAGYVNYQLQTGKWDIAVGLRTEYTNIKGEQMASQVDFDQRYTQFFPNAAFSYRYNDDQVSRFSYGRRINRPDYDYLNPFRYYVDAFVFFEGNPYLRPESAHSFELSHNYKGNLHVAIFFSRTNNVMTSVLQQIPEENVTIRSIANLDQYMNYGADVSYTVKPWKFWTSMNNMNIYHNDYRGSYKEQGIDNTGWAASFKSVNTLNVVKGWKMEVYGEYKTRQIEGMYRIDPMASVSAGISKGLLNDKLNLKFAVNDIFNTLNYKTKSFINGVDMKQNIRLDSRIYTLSVRYNFGSALGDSIRKRKDNEEQSRIRGGS